MTIVVPTGQSMDTSAGWGRAEDKRLWLDNRMTAAFLEAGRSGVVQQVSYFLIRGAGALRATATPSIGLRPFSFLRIFSIITG